MPNHMRTPIFVVLAAFVFASCAKDDVDPAAGEDKAPVVTIAASRFGPRELTVDVGATVTFVNTDPFAHTVTSRPGSALVFASGDLAQSEEFTVTFDEPGSYAYFCEIHPTMRAQVVVK
ncbi:MAG: hypothetical protein D6683_15135 [Actinomyces sp.]|nr:MAG: hypothetical protein D6683_15135 [Actinomyces sp.]